MTAQTRYQTLRSTPSPEAIQGYYDGMTQFWHPVLRSADLPAGEVRGVELLEEKIVLARLNGRLIAMEDLCRHFQAQLSQGEVRRLNGGDECLSCRYHGWAYDAAGQCVEIPQLYAGREIPASAKVPTFLTEERHGLIWVCLADRPAFPIPDFPELDDPAFHAGPLVSVGPWRGAAPRLIMGALDDTHHPWVHEGLLGDRSRVEPPDHKVWRDGPVLRVAFDWRQPLNEVIGGANGGQRIVAQDVDTAYEVGMPNVLRIITVRYPVDAAGQRGEGRRSFIIWLTTCPIRYNKTVSFWRLVRDFDRDPAHDHIYEEFEDKIRAQDKPLLESQRPWLLPPFWTKVQMPLRPADLPLIEYQKWMEEMGLTAAV